MHEIRDQDGNLVDESKIIFMTTWRQRIGNIIGGGKRVELSCRTPSAAESESVTLVCHTSPSGHLLFDYTADDFPNHHYI